MDTAAYRKCAEECEQMARANPHLAASFETLARSWWALAGAMEEMEHSKRGNSQNPGAIADAAKAVGAARIYHCEQSVRAPPVV